MEQLSHFVRMQTESAIRSLASQYPYDIDEDATNAMDQLSLRAGGERLANVLCSLVQSRMRIAGVEVVEVISFFLMF